MLAIRVEDVLDDLPEDGRREIMEVIASVLVQQDSWPAPGGRDGAVSFGSRSWMLFVAYADGIEIYDLGWFGDPPT